VATRHKLIRKEYRDSVALMQLSASLAKLPGVKQASAVMATPNNLALLRQAGMEIGEIDAAPSDLLIAVQGDDSALVAAIAEAEDKLAAKAPVDSSGPQQVAPRSIAMGLAEDGGAAAGLALISTPGDYATAEALKALNLGLNVMMFSDNVSGADEVMLKRIARDRDLIVMGPDCGTAIINGIPLAFANVVKRGPIGAVAASGTGLQEVTVLVDRLGSGISQAIGTGGHDLSIEVGGISMLQGLKALANDASTKVIVLISKPPAREIADQILALARGVGKPVVINFLGADHRAFTTGNLHGVRTLEDAARAAVALAQGRKIETPTEDIALPNGLPRLAPKQKYVRGLYSGGTFCYEAAMLLQETLAGVHSNTPVGSAAKLEDVWQSRGHTLVDLGDDLFTRGRPHPMIDHRLRNERIVREAGDPEVAVLLLDVVLGFGSHPDPAAELAPALAQARAIAERDGRGFVCVGHICGTAADPQNLTRQTDALKAAGMILTESNAQAVRLARQIAMGAAR